MIVRVLGGRLVVQAVAELAWGPRARVLNAGIDATHAASMIVAAWRWPQHRRSALVSAAVAAGTATLDLVA
jgi:hypothetical protein